MAHDKVTVDEPLISTDVDGLIRTIAERKKIALNALRQLCKIDKKTMDKWIAVLEDEGYISIEYGLGGTSIVWRGINDLSEEEKTARMENAEGQFQTEPTTTTTEQPTQGTSSLSASQSMHPTSQSTSSPSTSSSSGTSQIASVDASDASDNADEAPTQKDVSDSINSVALVAEEISNSDQASGDSTETQVPPAGDAGKESVKGDTEDTSDAEGNKINDEFTTEAPLEEDPEPEELLSQYLAKKRSGTGDIDSLKSSILTSLGDDKNGRTVAPTALDHSDTEAEAADLDTSIVRDGSSTSDTSGDSDDSEEPEDSDDERAKARDIGSKAPAEAESESATENQSEDDSDGSGSVRMPVVPMGSKGSTEARTQIIKPMGKEKAADVRELMGTYMEEINREKSRIDGLKKEREALYRDKFVTMEGKIQADIVVLTEKVIEKETKIATLKERVLELPDRVDQLSKLQEQMEKLKTEGRDALQRTRARTDEFIVGVGESKADVERKISDVTSVIESRSARLKELEKAGASLDVRSEKVRASLENARTQVDEITSTMSSLNSDLQQIEQMRRDIVAQTDVIKQTVATHGEELKSLEEELEGVERLEHWVQEYIRDYEGKIEDLEEYVSKSDEELADLKEAAESLYIKKYLGELENLADVYQSELSDALSREKDIEQRISESKGRITHLVKESQDMIKKLKSDMPEGVSDQDFGSLAARIKARTSKTKGLVEEKQQEREKLADESAKTRKTKPHITNPKSAASAAKKSRATASTKGKKRK